MDCSATIIVRPRDATQYFNQMLALQGIAIRLSPCDGSDQG